jgi:thiol-disulfide isomerase/thioredoxin
MKPKFLSISILLLCALALMIFMRHRSAGAATGEARLAKARPSPWPHLGAGTVAPEIAATDLDGRAMKLSDYRGKVALLVFWYSACGPCMAAVPREKALASRLAGRPFEVLGVNCDSTTASARVAVNKLSMPWKSFWNGGGGCSGPITRDWGAQLWPTYYILDEEGVIRHASLGADGLDEPLERTIAAAEAKARGKALSSAGSNEGRKSTNEFAPERNN